MKKNSKDKFVEALYVLLQQFPFDDINVNMIVKQSKMSHATFYRLFKDKYDLITVLFYQKIVPEFIDSKEMQPYYALARKSVLRSYGQYEFFKNAIADKHRTFLKLLKNKYIQIISKKMPKLTRTQYQVLNIYLNGTISSSIEWFLSGENIDINEMIDLFEIAMPNIIKDIFDVE